MGLKGFGFRILAVVYSGLIFLTCHFIYSGYSNHLKVAQHGALSTLDAIVSTLVSQIDGDSLDAIFRAYPFEQFDSIPFQSDQIVHINRLLATAQEQNELSTPIYTLTHDTVNDCFFVGAASNGTEPYGFHYNTPPSSLYDAYHQGGAIPAFEDDHGSWLSALQPIRNSSGVQVAALQADYPLDEFIMYAREDALKNIGFAVLLFGIIGIFLFSSLRKILALEEGIKQELESAKANLEQKNEEVTSSIEYALTIQENILPSKLEMEEFLGDLLIFNRPRDIVSGDFYWFHKLDEHRALIAVADCTGHGVPGALMSMTGYNYLNEAVQEQKLASPAQILEFLDAKICATFGNNCTSDYGNDGMDIALCLVDNIRGSITFSGARRPLSIVGANKTTNISGTRRGIGEHFLAKKFPFIDEVVQQNEDETYFLYSDGLQDQFGGERSMKLLRKRLVSWLHKLILAPSVDQESILQKMLEKWQGGNRQVDDICLVGFRMKATSTPQA